MHIDRSSTESRYTFNRKVPASIPIFHGVFLPPSADTSEEKCHPAIVVDYSTTDPIADARYGFEPVQKSRL